MTTARRMNKSDSLNMAFSSTSGFPGTNGCKQAAANCSSAQRPQSGVSGEREGISGQQPRSCSHQQCGGWHGDQEAGCHHPPAESAHDDHQSIARAGRLSMAACYQLAQPQRHGSEPVFPIPAGFWMQILVPVSGK
jgi:hypothetical protein